MNFPADTSKIYAPESAFADAPATISITITRGSDGTDYGDGKADWQNAPTNVFNIEGKCPFCGDACEYYNPHNGVFFNDVLYAEDFI